MRGASSIFAGSRGEEPAIVPVRVVERLLGALDGAPRLPPFLAAAIDEVGIVSIR